MLRPGHWIMAKKPDITRTLPIPCYLLIAVVTCSVGMVFMPNDDALEVQAKAIIYSLSHTSYSPLLLSLNLKTTLLSCGHGVHAQRRCAGGPGCAISEQPKLVIMLFTCHAICCLFYVALWAWCSCPTMTRWRRRLRYHS
jgi:hypothetical protein